MDALFAECLLVQGGFAFLSSKPLFEERSLSLPDGSTRWKRIDDEQRCAEIAKLDDDKGQHRYVSEQKFYQVERTAEKLIETEIEVTP